MILKDLFDSIFRPAAYAGFARQRAGRAVLYLILIALPLALLGGFRLAIVCQEVAGGLSDALASSPDFQIVDGQLEFDAPQPYVLTVDGEELGVVDTTGATNRSALDGHENYVLVLKDRVIVRNGLDRREIPFGEMGSGLTLTRDAAAALMKAVAAAAWIYAAIWVICSVGSKFVAAVLLTLLTLAVAAGRRQASTFQATFGIAVHALTLSLLLGFVRVYLGMTVLWFGLIYWGAAVVYCVAASGLLPPIAPGPRFSGPSGPSE